LVPLARIRNPVTQVETHLVSSILCGSGKAGGLASRRPADQS
jgi:hypothetical protein